MRRITKRNLLTTRQKFGLSISAYVFLFLMLLAFTFYVVFSNTIMYRVKKEISAEATKIVNSNIALDNGKIVFLVNKDGKDIREEFLTSNFSGLFLDKNLKLIRGFGFFSYYDNQNANTLKQLVTITKTSIEKRAISEATLEWQGDTVFVYAVPLLNDKEVYGVAVLGRSVNELDIILETLTLVFLIFGIVSLVGSFIMGQFLGARFFSPLKKLLHVIDDIDLDSIAKRLEISGHPEDEIYQLTQRFNIMLDRIQDMATQQKEFVSNVSHELRTPLTKAISTLEVLKINSSHKSDVDILLTDLFEISELLEQLLVLSKLRKGSIRTDESSNLKQAIDTVRYRFKGSLTGNKLQFISHVTSDIFVRIPKEFTEVLVSNLLSNSIKYSDAGATITISASVENSLLKIYFSDTGHGIPEDKLDKIFERFYRASNNNYSSVGHGVGLSIIKRICDLYNVTIAIKSRVGEGTEFVFTIQDFYIEESRPTSSIA